ncbi:pyruvoyl-dependent arginine decarboxylase [Candidatus Woesearchaeota archaeon]|nr:pyruvoyl-dependent arginine decarboxylase [Candidatus Woesearchaeota archaeon]
MEIQLVKGVGEGSTELSAFHAALMDAGIGRLNLIPLSSVVPIGAKIKDIVKLDLKDENHGYFQFLVMSKQSANPGESACAGMGWIQYPDGRGYFVEHHEHSQEEVETLIEKSLKDILSIDIDNLKMFNLEKEEVEINSYCSKIMSDDKYSCAVVGALYKLEKPL